MFQERSDFTLNIVLHEFNEESQIWRVFFLYLGPLFFFFSLSKTLQWWNDSRRGWRYGCRTALHLLYWSQLPWCTNRDFPTRKRKPKTVLSVGVDLLCWSITRHAFWESTWIPESNVCEKVKNLFYLVAFGFLFLLEILRRGDRSVFPVATSPGNLLQALFFSAPSSSSRFPERRGDPRPRPPAPRSGLHHPWLPQEDRLSYRESLRDSGVSRTWGRLGDSASSGRSLSSSRPASRFISGTLGVRVFPLRLPPEWAGMDRLPGSTTRLEDGAPAFTPLKGGKRSWVSSDETNTFRCKKNAGCRNCEFLIFKWWIICCRRMWFSVSLRKT